MMYTTSGDEGRLQRFDGTVASWLPDILQHNIGELDLFPFCLPSALTLPNSHPESMSIILILFLAPQILF